MTSMSEDEPGTPRWVGYLFVVLAPFAAVVAVLMLLTDPSGVEIALGAVQALMAVVCGIAGFGVLRRRS